jgi:hypothetical protein
LSWRHVIMDVFFLTGTAGALPFHYIRGKNCTRLLDVAAGGKKLKHKKKKRS